MSVETSNAPRELWAVIDPTQLGEGHEDADGVLPTGVISTTTDETVARMSALTRDQALNRKRPDRKHLATAYVRRDLVVPTVDEIENALCAAIAGRLTIGPAGLAAAVHALLLSRIEGDNDADR